MQVEASERYVAQRAGELPIGNQVQELRQPDKGLLAEYSECALAAEEHFLSRAEAMQCSDLYLRLKISLLPDVTMEDFYAHSYRERWEIQKRGYAAYRAWLSHRFHQ